MKPSKNGLLLNRREAMFLSAGAGLGLALSNEAHGSDSIKTGRSPGTRWMQYPALSNRKYSVRQGPRLCRWWSRHFQRYPLWPDHSGREPLAAGETADAVEG